MYRKKIAIYVEGQTEQIFINHLILAQWNYTGVKIRNIKLQSYQDSVCKVQDFLPDIEDESALFFLITDVDGVGSLISAIANRANSQLKNGFKILGLRDLSAQDFNDLPTRLDLSDRINKIIQKFKTALQTSECEKPETIELFLAVMTIEAWLLAFTKAVSKWAKVSEEITLLNVPNRNIEEINAPITVLKKIGNRKKDPKSFDEVVSLVSNITDSEIESVYKGKRVPNFNKFWDRLISLCEHN